MRWCWERAEACIKENHFGKEVRKVVKKKCGSKSALRRTEHFLTRSQRGSLGRLFIYLFIFVRLTKTTMTLRPKG